MVRIEFLAYFWAPTILPGFPGRNGNVCPWACVEVVSVGSLEHVTNCI